VRRANSETVSGIVDQDDEHAEAIQRAQHLPIVVIKLTKIFNKPRVTGSSQITSDLTNHFRLYTIRDASWKAWKDTPNTFLKTFTQEIHISKAITEFNHPSLHHCMPDCQIARLPYLPAIKHMLCMQSNAMQCHLHFCQSRT